MSPLTHLAEAQARFDDAQRERRRIGGRYSAGLATSEEVKRAEDAIAITLERLARAEEAARAHFTSMIKTEAR